MKKKEIQDENTLIEVYLHWLLDNGCEINRVGHIHENENLGMYYVWDKRTEKYIVIASDWAGYIDKRIKKELTRYKKALIIFYPMEKEWFKKTEKSLEETLRFLGMGDRDSEIIFGDTRDFEFAQQFLKNTLDTEE